MAPLTRPLLTCAGLLALSLAGCDCTSGQSACTPACGVGFVCDEDARVCVSTQLDLYELAMPGRGAQIVQTQQGPLVAAIAPTQRSVIINPPADAPRLLAQDVRAGSSNLELAQGPQQTLVLWINSQGSYTLAEHTGDDFSRNWRVGPLPMPAPSAASDDADVAVAIDGSVHVVARDTSTGSLVHLWRPSPEEPWSREVVDDGRTKLAPDPCPQTTRTQQSQGVGREPSLLAAPSGELVVAYQDADCGDLRVARKGDVEWVVGLVDRGVSLDAQGGFSVTGRWPSLALFDDRIGISYQDFTLGRLMFAQSSAQGFDIEVVDPGVGLDLFSKRPKKIVGAFTHLSFDAQGAPLISYFDATDTALMTARAGARSPRTWTLRARASEGLVGFFATHARLDSGSVQFVCEQLTPSDQGVQSALLSIEEAP